MISTWFLVITLSGSGGSVAIPQLNHAVCIRNRNEEIKRAGVTSAFCTKGALPQN